ncbi:isoprenyl transferase [Oenococcus alcoholitolerans]|uniref:isoprenyl transferase n=1 Tax=Oenococcus alcoholitolerans TaxID=931074 RepID=UPI003F7014E5
MAFFGNEKGDRFEQGDLSVPNHIAIIMDGNGRWAKKRHMPRTYGHRNAVSTVKKIALAANELGVKILTLYAFSTENWNRPSDEVNFLMKLPIDFFDSFVPELIANNVKIMTIGSIEKLPKPTLKAINKAVDETSGGTGMILNFAMNYGGRDEIVEATKKIADSVKNGLMKIEDIDENSFKNFLFTSQFGENAYPDLIIRTSGEQRISNFLLWQNAYSEFYFTNKLWPDFDSNDLTQAIKSFDKRDRRYGRITNEN